MIKKKLSKLVCRNYKFQMLEKFYHFYYRSVLHVPREFLQTLASLRVTH